MADVSTGMTANDAVKTRATGIKAVAADAGVSVGTVSNVLNHPERVSTPVSERVQASIDHLGYVPNEAARQLRMGVIDDRHQIGTPPSIRHPIR